MTRAIRSLLLAPLLVVACSSAARADVFAKVGTFDKPTTTGVQTIEVGFPPKAIWIWTVRTTATGLADGYHFAFGFGACEGFGYSIYIGGNDNAEALNSIVHMAGGEDATIVRMNPTATSMSSGDPDLAQFQNCDDDSFDLNWTNATASAFKMAFAVLGGDEVSAAVMHANTGTGAATRAVTGLGLEPQFLMALSLFSTISPNSSPLSGSLPGIGASDCTRQGHAAAALDDDSNPSNANRLLRTTHLTGKVNDGGSVSPSTILVSCDADGWTWQVSNHVTSGVGALGLRAPQIYFGSDLKPTTTGVQALTATGVTDPKLVFLWTISAPSDTNVQADANVGFGASDGTNSVFTWIGSKDNVSPVVSAVELNTTAVLKMADPDATAANSTTLGLATLQSFGSEQVNVNWTTADATEREFLYAVFGGEGELSGGSTGFSPFLVGETYWFHLWLGVALCIVSRRPRSVLGRRAILAPPGKHPGGARRT